ncbi:MAG: HPr(Ser) kinase/phosphatase [Gammaproteobacteria bacterium]
MSEILTAESIIFSLSSKIELQWIAGQEDPKRPLHEIRISDHATLIGHLNLIHKNIIQVIGKTECEYLKSSDEQVREGMLQQLFKSGPVAILVTDNIPAPDELVNYANEYHVPLLSCDAESNEVVDAARFYLHEMFSDKQTVHGVFMEVLGTGVLITGESSVGKSELALELISRGHRLVADDAPVFTRIGPDVLDGSSPTLLQDFMEVRGLGVINIREMYGDNALKNNKYLRLVIQLKRLSQNDREKLDRLHGNRNLRDILGVEIPVILIPVAPGRNLAVLVEAAVRNHILRDSGHDATEQLIELHQQAINNNQIANS